MKDVVLITACISVTDAYYYDIKNDFNCLKMLLRLWEHNVAEIFTASSKIKAEWGKRESERREMMLEKLHNLFKSRVDYDSKVGLITCFAFFSAVHPSEEILCLWTVRNLCRKVDQRKLNFETFSGRKEGGKVWVIFIQKFGVKIIISFKYTDAKYILRLAPAANDAKYIQAHRATFYLSNKSEGVSGRDYSINIVAYTRK